TFGGRCFRHDPVAHRLQTALAGDRVLGLGDTRHGLLRAAWLAAGAGLVSTTLTPRSGVTAGLAATPAPGIGATRTLGAVAVEFRLRGGHEALQIAFLEARTGQSLDGLVQLLLIGADQGNRLATASGAAGTTD